MKLFTSLSIALALALAGCGGGGPAGTPSTGTGGSGGGPTNYTYAAIAATNALGGPLKAFATFEKVDFAGASGETGAIMRRAGTSQCVGSTQYYVPDLAGDVHSSEVKYFYDSACTAVARDSVRTFQPSTGTSELVQTAEKLYAFAGANNTGPVVAQRDDTTTIYSSTFDGNGYPSRGAGFSRESNGFLNIGNTKTIFSNYELVVAPATGPEISGGGSGSGTGSVNSFCSDQAGYNAVGVGTSGNTFGWTGLASSGTRTVNSDGSVTWSSTHTGNGYIAPIGTMSIAVNSLNSSCPITAPAYTISGGGTPIGSHSIPYTATYVRGLLTGLTISGATVEGGLGLSVATTPNTSPQDDMLLVGTLTNANGTVATFNVNAFGDGTLTIDATGNQFTITDWHVRTQQGGA